MSTTKMETESPQDAAADTSMLAVCKRHLDDEEWHYDVHERDDRTYITAGAKGVNGSYKVILDIKEEKQMLIIYVQSNINFPSANLIDVANYLTRSNYGLSLGNFELDMNDGEVRYKCSTVVAGSSLSKESVDRMMHASLITMDRYFGNMVKVGYGVMKPDEANKQCEGGDYLQGALRSLVEGRETSSNGGGNDSSSASSIMAAISGLLESHSASQQGSQNNSSSEDNNASTTESAAPQDGTDASSQDPPSDLRSALRALLETSGSGSAEGAGEADKGTIEEMDDTSIKSTNE